MAIETGTFSGTGNSVGVVGGKLYIDMTFAGTATVNVQWQLDGTNWRTIDSYTASAQIVVESGGIPTRLNCSAHTDNVTYAIRQK
jgi:hypothetical protein